MKKIISVIIVLVLSNIVYSQNTMLIHKTNGAVITYPITDIDSITFTTDTATICTITASASPATICAGGSSTLTASGATTYLWNNGIGTLNPVTVSPGSTTTYTVTGTDANGCTGTASVTVTVISNLSVTVTASPSSVCEGASSVLTANGATTYSWDNGLGVGNPKTITPGSTTTYTVTGATAGCTDDASITVTVNPAPIVTATAAPTAICPGIYFGANCTLTASGATTYSWDNGLGSGNPQGVLVNTTTTYTVTGTANGCTGTTNVTVTVYPQPPVTISASRGAVCAGDASTLTASGAAIFLWNGGETGNSIIVSPTLTTIYTVTGTDVFGCTGTASTTVTVGNGLPVTASASPDAICAGASSTLTASGADTYLWNHGLGTENPVMVTPTATTSYMVTGTSSGCSGTANVIVTLKTSPASIHAHLPVSQGEGDINYDFSICDGTAISFCLLPYPNSFTSIQWYDNGTPVSGATENEFFPAVNTWSIGIHSISVSVDDECPANTIDITTLPISGYNYNDLFDGGQIFYFAPPACNSGLVATLDNEPSTYAWTDSTGNNISTGASSETDGASNTTKIMNMGPASGAAKQCRDKGDGESWFLPARYQLEQLGYNDTIHLTNPLTNGSYWSSTEYIKNEARYVNSPIWMRHIQPASARTTKTTVYYVRCVRVFP